MSSRGGTMAEGSGLVHTLQSHIDDIRTLIQCGICIRPLYEPFTLACGHTFCYSCLTSWFSGGKEQRTCPDCRAPVKTQPAPAYLIRTMVQMFTGRAELVDKGESTKEHAKNQKEEADRLDQDKANNHPTRGGLFGGLFRPKAAVPQPVIDVDDGVVRCPHCAWELEEGDTCAGCGYVYQPDENESDDSESGIYSRSEDGSMGGDNDYDDFDDQDPVWTHFANSHPHNLIAGGYRGSGIPAEPRNLLDQLTVQDQINRGNRMQNPANVPYYNGMSRRANRDPYGEDMGSEEEEDSEEEGENEYDEDDPFIDDDGMSGPPTSSFVGTHGHDTSGEVYDLQSEPSTGTAVDDDDDDGEQPSTDGLLQWRDATPYIEQDSDESGEAERIEDSEADSDEEEINIPSRRRQPQLASLSRGFQIPSEAPWLSARSNSARARRPIIPDSDEAEESAASESSSEPPPRPAARRTGASVGNAIALDDSDDDQPVGPMRRNTQRRNNRFSPY
ncbi:unnamed protein product [Penicillium olsonii]|uniref:RING-type domain-containing protein n=1 Tax=Penicillium olsonii TaxID=99116 RepID=A0A9W4MT29_PENOL|nr:unnamed protein product [Penicillium olsonii]CAG8282381.1 unnamed protein product [Penicillium olsonii]